jgi:hypothetical protein
MCCSILILPAKRRRNTFFPLEWEGNTFKGTYLTSFYQKWDLTFTFPFEGEG